MSVASSVGAHAISRIDSTSDSHYRFVSDALLAAKSSDWRNSKHRQQWRVTLETYCAPLWDLPVDEVATGAILSVLHPLWQRAPETALRVRGRIEAVLDFAKAHGWRSGETRRPGAGTWP